MVSNRKNKEYIQPSHFIFPFRSIHPSTEPLTTLWVVWVGQRTRKVQNYKREGYNKNLDHLDPQDLLRHQTMSSHQIAGSFARQRKIHHSKQKILLLHAWNQCNPQNYLLQEKEILHKKEVQLTAISIFQSRSDGIVHTQYFFL